MLHNQNSSFQCSVDHELNALVQRFWEQEKEPSAAVIFTPDEKKCEDLFALTHRRTPTGRYVVRLPLFTSVSIHLLAAMERHCEDARFGEMYRAFMKENEDLQHMEEIRASPGKDYAAVCYLSQYATSRIMCCGTPAPRRNSGSYLTDRSALSPEHY